MFVNNLLLITILILGVKFSLCCETGQIKQGCLIRNLVCSCGVGCISDYRYDTIQECQAALKGKKKDICKVNNPCMNGGTCIQISQSPGYKCRCEGTGFFGMRCSRACPVYVELGRTAVQVELGRTVVIPYECIVI